MSRSEHDGLARIFKANLARNAAREFTAPDHARVVEQPAASLIRDEPDARRVRVAAACFEILTTRESKYLAVRQT